MAPRKLVLLVVIAASLLLTGAPAALAQSGGGDATVHHLVVSGRMTDVGCPSGRNPCLVVLDGSLADLKPGDTVNITFVNQDEDEHDLAVTTTALMDPTHHDTAWSSAIGHTAQDVEGNTAQSFEFTIPANAAGLYLWCDIPGHEDMGMWIQVTFSNHTETPSTEGLQPSAGNLVVAGRMTMADQPASMHCPAGTTMCLTVLDGDLAELTPGQSVHLWFVNQDDDQPHDLAVTTLAKADSSHQDTAWSDALGHTAQHVAPGTGGDLELTIPSTATGLYLWCDEPGHEAAGMYLEHSFSAKDTANPTPLGAALPILAGLGAALILVRRHRA